MSRATRAALMIGLKSPGTLTPSTSTRSRGAIFQGSAWGENTKTPAVSSCTNSRR